MSAGTVMMMMAAADMARARRRAAAPVLPAVFDVDFDSRYDVVDGGGAAASSWTDQISAEVISPAGAPPIITTRDGHQVLQFANDLLQGAFSTVTLTRPFSVVAVIESTMAGATQGVVFDGDDAAHRAGLYRNGGTWRTFSSSEDDSGVATGGEQCIAIVFGASEVTTYVDDFGTAASLAGSDLGGGVLDGLTVGRAYSGTVGMTGYVWRILIADSDITASLPDLAAYLAATYPSATVHT